MHIFQQERKRKMSEDLATQSYIDYQLDLNEQTHQRLFNRIQDLERQIRDLQNELDYKISSLERQISDIERRY